MPPLPQRPPQSSPDQFHRGGDSWRPHIPQGNFTFRNHPSVPQFPQDGDRYRPPDDRGRRNNDRRGAGSYNRRQGPRWATAERPLLSSKRGNSPENVLAQIDAQNKRQHFLPADDVSDSDEQGMDESDADERPGSDSMQLIASKPLDEEIVNEPNPPDAADILERPTKRRATATTVKDVNDATNVPRWSNPDPYTVLPPMDESQRKRKDVVKIIRKARIAGEKEYATPNQVAANDDFISFGLGDDNEPDGKSLSPTAPVHARKDELGVRGAPTGPRSFSHRNNLHNSDINRPPGIFGDRPSAIDLGPPPGMTNQAQSKSEQHMERRDSSPDQMEALGNRKRTFDDSIKGDALPKAGGKKAAPNGSVLQVWIPRGNTDPTPWLAGDHRPTKNSGFRLHKEICDFYEFVRPQKHEQILREDLLHRLQTVVKKRLPDCDLYCFGSFAAGMYLPNADMDLVIISSTFRTSGDRVACQSNKTMHSFAYHLESIGLAKSGSIQVIFHAKVPIIKFIDQMTDIQVDVSFENETGLIANETFNTWKQQFPAMPILTTFMKQFLKMRGLDEVMNGGLGGFSITCLVTSLLQNLPRVQSGEVAPEQNLGEILLEFLDLYGNQFDLTRTGISMNPPGYYDKQAAGRFDRREEVYKGNRGERLAIIDPNNGQNDISGGSKNVGRIFDLFSEAQEEILKAMRSPNRISLLDWTHGGDYQVFTIQRRRLQDLYNMRWGTTESARITMGLLAPHSTTSNRTFEISQKENVPFSGLSENMFLNPLDPNVVVQEKQKPPRPPKPKKQKKTTSGTQGGPSVTRNQSKKLHIRARKLKAKFPSMAMEIPDTVTKQERRAIVDKAKMAGLKTIRPPAKEKKKPTKTTQKVKKPSKVRRTSLKGKNVKHPPNALKVMASGSAPIPVN